MSHKKDLGGGEKSWSQIKQPHNSSTGIPGLDKVLNEGFPKNSLLLLSGTSGTGKTIFSFQWLFDGAKNNENGIYILLTEPLSKTIKNLEHMSFYDPKLLEQEKLTIFDVRGIYSKEDSDEKKLLNFIVQQVRRTHAKRLVIDSITAVLYKLDNKIRIRKFIFELGKTLSALDCTTILTSEARSKDDSTAYGVEEFIADGIISLSMEQGEQSTVRNLSIVKLRGQNFRSGKIDLDITSDGIVLYPKIPIERVVAKTDFKIRQRSGIKNLDKMIGGGYPQGHMILISGNTGTGKTTFAMQFLVEGLKNNEKAVFVNLEEPVQQVKKTALEHSWDFDKFEKQGMLIFVSPSLIDTQADKLLYQIVDAVEKTDAKRIAIDAISTLESAHFNPNRVREFLLQLYSYLKRKGVCCVMTYLATSIFGAETSKLLAGGVASELRLSSVVDGTILLRYWEQKSSIRKIMTVLKMRGVRHDKSIKTFEITHKGIEIGGGPRLKNRVGIL